jgi:hypothetical protein
MSFGGTVQFLSTISRFDVTGWELSLSLRGYARYKVEIFANCEMGSEVEKRNLMRLQPSLVLFSLQLVELIWDKSEDY